MQNLSVTQTTNLTALVGVVVMILNHYKINVGSDELMNFAGAVLTVISLITNFVNRYQKGDLTLAGMRK